MDFSGVIAKFIQPYLDYVCTVKKERKETQLFTLFITTPTLFEITTFVRFSILLIFQGEAMTTEVNDLPVTLRHYGTFAASPLSSVAD